MKIMKKNRIINTAFEVYSIIFQFLPLRDLSTIIQLYHYISKKEFNEDITYRRNKIGYYLKLEEKRRRTHITTVVKKLQSDFEQNYKKCFKLMKLDNPDGPYEYNIKAAKNIFLSILCQPRFLLKILHLENNEYTKDFIKKQLEDLHYNFIAGDGGYRYFRWILFRGKTVGFSFLGVRRIGATLMLAITLASIFEMEIHEVLNFHVNESSRIGRNHILHVLKPTQREKCTFTFGNIHRKDVFTDSDICFIDNSGHITIDDTQEMTKLLENQKVFLICYTTPGRDSIGPINFKGHEDSTNKFSFAPVIL